MQNYSKAIAALVGGILTFVYIIWGEALALPAGWPETAAAGIVPLLTVIAVIKFPKNKER